ncbi:putative disease resistance protein RGA3 [Magnolia sinica]|uniref:putative disease resistance protein RGA3 n=1 Tax=Magnolia sinica TaxID=86752 RepID=UPI002659249C|nr:putative disease resistance protein RGA3 [Magnolia sinica]XP_058107651.1 putative disease resistance protein RGA3 [Magnolia sinica]
MADGLVSLVVESLGSAAVQELSSLVGVKKDLEKLSRTFESLQAALSDAEKRQVKDEQVRNWLEKLKDVAYDIDDVLEEWKVVIDGCDDDTSSGDGTVSAHSFSPCFCFDRVTFQVKTGRRINAISRRLDEINEHKDRFFFREFREEGGIVELDTMETSSLIDETEIFGRERDKERIVSWLLSEGNSNEEGIPVISIVGMGGIGKTALAQVVCKDERVKRHFDETIWVSLPHDFDVMRVYLAIIKISGMKFSEFELHKKLLHSVASSLEDLQPTVQVVLQQKQFLLVLDGVRNIDEDRWERLMISLKEAAKGSRILVTTRNEHVTKTFAPTMMHELQPLFQNDCWSLFSHRAFSGGRRGDELVKLEALGREIVINCRGIPLLVKAIGIALRSKTDVRDRQSVLEEGTWDSLDAEKIAPSLSVSFHDLPQHLKQCFAFCSIFPKDHLIEKDKLIKLWMAQGFILPKGRVEMERLGGSYFDDLMRRSLFQIIETDEDGYAKYCTMHDMIHDLCKSIMGECFIIQEKTPKSHLAKARHASWICNGNVESIPSFIYKVGNLRTLLLIGWSKVPSISNHFFRRLKHLRALDLSGSRIKRLPNSLQNLKLLRYLDLSATEIQELPEFISSLCLLQTLKLNHCCNLRKLPKRIVKLIKLRHLETEGTYLEYLPEGMGGLTSLRTLTKFVPGVERGCKITDLKDLNLLQGELEITCLNRVASRDEANEEKLENKQNLHTLQLSCKAWMCLETHIGSEVEQVEGVFEGLQPHQNLRDLTMSDYIGHQFPSWMEDCSLYSNLTKVQLLYCRCRQMPALGKLPSLKWLKIKAMFEVRQVGSEFCGSNHGGITGTFPKLEILLFERMYIWEEWELNVGAGSIPSLFQLCIESCDMLKALPELQHLTSLQELKIRDCPILDNRCQKEVGEDWNKIAHIPSITIDGRKIQ